MCVCVNEFSCPIPCRYAEAKALGEEVNTSRNTISESVHHSVCTVCVCVCVCVYVCVCVQTS